MCPGDLDTTLLKLIDGVEDVWEESFYDLLRKKRRTRGQILRITQSDTLLGVHPEVEQYCKN